MTNWPQGHRDRYLPDFLVSGDSVCSKDCLYRYSQSICSSTWCSFSLRLLFCGMDISTLWMVADFSHTSSTHIQTQLHAHTHMQAPHMHMHAHTIACTHRHTPPAHTNALMHVRTHRHANTYTIGPQCCVHIWKSHSTMHCPTYTSIKKLNNIEC